MDAETASMTSIQQDPVTASPDGEDERLLGFYDRLRSRVLAWAARRRGKMGGMAVRALVTVPDVFFLLVRLSVDKEVPERHRALIGGALAYFLLPFDLIPEGLVGPAGYIDDLVLAALVLESAFDSRLEALSRKHWSGSEDLRKTLQDLAGAGSLLLGDRLFLRLRNVVLRKGPWH